MFVCFVCYVCFIGSCIYVSVFRCIFVFVRNDVVFPCDFLFFFCQSRRRNTICALVTGVQTCALPICYRRATAIRPDFSEAISNEATLLARLKRFAKAVRRFDDAMAIKPGLPWLRGLRCHEKQVLCDWSSFDEDCRQITEQLAAGRPASPPFPLASLPAPPALQRQCAELYSAQMYPPQPPEQPSTTPDSGRLRIGYFSADFHNHATAYLAAGLFEQHDRARFEIFAFSFGPDRKDAMRPRLVKGFDHFNHVRGLADRDIRRLASHSGTQTDVGLQGPTPAQRTAIFPGRATTLQVGRHTRRRVCADGGSDVCLE